MTNEKKNIFENVISTTTKPVAGFSLYQDLEGNKESPAEKIYDKMETTQAQALRKKQMDNLIKGDTAEGQEASQRNPKRYLVDPGTGVISIDEEEGDLSYRDAVLTSASIIGNLRAQSGDSSDGAVQLFKEAISAIKENRVSTLQDTEKKKEFYVDDDSGIIVQDPENGDLTLSEARAIAQSRKRVSAPNDGITKEGLELLKRDMRDELKQAIESLGKDNQDPPFIFDNEGKPMLNPKSKGMSLSDVLAYQFITKPQNQQGMYKDSDGHIMSLNDALDLKRFEREEDRKDKKLDSLQELVAEARKQMPLIGEGVKEILSRRTIAERQGNSQEQQEAETEEAKGGETSENQSAEV